MIGELFTLLAERRRRRVLVSLLDAGEGPVPVANVAFTRGSAAQSSAGAAAGSAAVGAGERSEAVPESTALRHVHLPKLDESDLVDWDEEAGTVARGPRYAEVEPFLELLVRNQHELPGHLV
jgi:hypothetical protein